MADEESLLELGELEAKFIANGKSYGYSKDALRSYVELRLADVEARRTRKEEQVKIKQELDDDTRKVGVRIELKLLDRFNFRSNPWQNFSPQKPLTSQNPSPGKAGNVVSPDSASPLNWPKRTLPCR